MIRKSRTVISKSRTVIIKSRTRIRESRTIIWKSEQSPNEDCNFSPDDFHNVVTHEAVRKTGSVKHPHYCVLRIDCFSFCRPI